MLYRPIRSFRKPLVALLAVWAPGVGLSAQAQALQWEVHLPESPLPTAPLLPPAQTSEPVVARQPLEPPSEAARSNRPLQWELVPLPAPPAPYAESPATPPASLVGSNPLVARSTGLRWELIPEDQAVDPVAAIAEFDARPDPPPLVATPPPRWPKVRGLGRGITVNGDPYPDVALYVPNGFAMDQQFIATATFDWVGRVRSCTTPEGGNWTDCADAVAYLDITPFKGENASLGFQWAVQSLSGRNEGTGTLAGQSLGFRTAVNLTPTTGLAFGGEHIIQLDNTTDLGRNFYLVLSQAIPLSGGTSPILLVGTAGIGSDFYGYSGNGTLGSTDCLSGNNISSRNFPSGTDCFWGPIGSVSLSLGSRFAVGFEYFGFGIGAGISARPLGDLPLTFSFYATDFLGNTPGYLDGLCTTNPCQTRVYGRVSMSF